MLSSAPNSQISYKIRAKIPFRILVFRLLDDVRELWNQMVTSIPLV
jgi:hypothetical protein